MASKLSVRGIVFSALFAALLALASLLNQYLSFSAIPFSLENLIVMLAGGVLGARYGFFSMLLVVFLTAIGIPMLHGSGGLSVILGPTGGFIWAFPISAWLIGLIVPRIKLNNVISLILIFLTFELFGSLILYVTGVPWLMHVTHFPLQKALIAACYPFLPGDAIKAALATFMLVPIRKALPFQSLQSSGSIFKSQSS